MRVSGLKFNCVPTSLSSMSTPLSSFKARQPLTSFQLRAHSGGKSHHQQLHHLQELHSHKELALPAKASLTSSIGIDTDIGKDLSGVNEQQLSQFRALVLDVSYRPIDTLPWTRAVVLDFFEKVDVLEYYDSFVRSSRDYHYLPAVIRVKFYVKKLKGAFDKGVPLTRKNVYARDHNECQYCGSRKTLTLDHVIPTSKGGKSSWENLVTCCSTCNQRKANKDLSQLNMKLKKHPKQPSHYEMSSYMIKAQNSGNQAPAEWKDYLPPGAAEWVFDRE